MTITFIEGHSAVSMHDHPIHEGPLGCFSHVYSEPVSFHDIRILKEPLNRFGRFIQGLFLQMKNGVCKGPLDYPGHVFSVSVCTCDNRV